MFSPENVSLTLSKVLQTPGVTGPDYYRCSVVVVVGPRSACGAHSKVRSDLVQNYYHYYHYYHYQDINISRNLVILISS